MAMNQRIRASLPLFQKVLASDSLSSGRSTLQKISPNFITAERNYATAPAKSDKIKVSEEGNKSATLIITARIFSVIWNFDQVKNSGHECYRNQQGMESCYSYKIVLKDESIVDSRFMLVKFAVSDTPEAPLVVATPMKVTSFSISTQQ